MICQLAEAAKPTTLNTPPHATNTPATTKNMRTHTHTHTQLRLLLRELRDSLRQEQAPLLILMALLALLSVRVRVTWACVVF